MKGAQKGRCPHGGPQAKQKESVDESPPCSRLIVQNDGNLVIYRPGAIPVWATNTHSSV